MNRPTYSSLSASESFHMAQLCPPRFMQRLHEPEVFHEATRVLGRWWVNADRVLRERGRAGVLNEIQTLEAQIAENEAGMQAANIQLGNANDAHQAALMTWREDNGIEGSVLLSQTLEDDYVAHVHAELKRVNDHRKAIHEQGHYLRSQLGVTWALLNRFDRHGDTLAPTWCTMNDDTGDAEEVATRAEYARALVEVVGVWREGTYSIRPVWAERRKDHRLPSHIFRDMATCMDKDAGSVLRSFQRWRGEGVGAPKGAAWPATGGAQAVEEWLQLAERLAPQYAASKT